MKDIAKVIGTRIKMLRFAKHMQQTELAKRMGISQTHMSNIESCLYTHLRAHETPEHIVCRLLLEKKKKKKLNIKMDKTKKSIYKQ